jgi:hypothetical protein
MSRNLRQLSQNQAQVNVAQSSHESLDKAWFATLAVSFAGVFYFYGYYFFGGLWRVLTEG